MNERFRELAMAAANWASEQDADKWWTQEFNKKFAELIVQECVNAIQAEKDTGLYNAQQMAGMTVSIAVIDDLFGVTK